MSGLCEGGNEPPGSLKGTKECHKQDQVNIKCARICSDHFESVTDYEDDMKNRLLGLKERKILKKNALPSLNIPSSKAASDSNREDRYQKRNIRKAAFNHLQTLSPKKPRLEPSTGSSEYVNITQGSEETSVVSEVHCLKCDERGKQIYLLKRKHLKANEPRVLFSGRARRHSRQARPLQVLLITYLQTMQKAGHEHTPHKSALDLTSATGTSWPLEI
ncbi:hypothetical protein ANN_00408 [Periplaneta americana]|uniref:THAP-type domain-containing protein n=1 Tax=Periplaneta americana TaxID=6978 RepID=A0ABQ8TTX7_PERAM|nr:hypothetical protein ANN_00408 [Periplaneta americana]